LAGYIRYLDGIGLPVQVLTEPDVDQINVVNHYTTPPTNDKSTGNRMPLTLPAAATALRL